MNREAIIHWKHDKDPYFRKGVELADAEVTYLDNKKGSGSSERLSATLLKATQDYFFDYTKQEHFKLLADKKTIKLEDEYKKIYIQKKQIILSNEEANESYKKAKPQLQRLANKQAWKEVLKEQINEDELILKFDAMSITSVANLDSISSTKLYEEIKKIQHKFNSWTEKVFDISSGEIIEVDYHGSLFPFSSLQRKGHGKRNIIEIKIAKEMAHYILFLNKNFLKYHLQVFIALKNSNATTLYSILIKATSPKFRGKPYTVEKLKNIFNVKYKTATDLKAKVLKPALASLNKTLQTEVTIKPFKELGKTIGFYFEFSKIDEEILKGERIIGDFFPTQERKSFGYYLALLDLHSNIIDKKDLYNKSIEYNNKLLDSGLSSDAEMKKHYSDYCKNLESYEKLEHIKIKTFTIDEELMIAIDNKTKLALGATATLCLEKIQKKTNQPTLPGFNDYEDNYLKGIEDLLPFMFSLTGSSFIDIDINNLHEYRKQIEMAIAFKQKKQFRFLDQKSEDIFINDILNDTKTIETEIIETYEENILLLRIREDYPDFQKNKDEEWNDLLNDLEKNSNLSKEEFANLISVVADYLLKDKDGRKYYMSNIKSSKWFLEKWDSIYQKAITAQKNKPVILPDNINIFDIYSSMPKEEKKYEELEHKDEKPF